MTCHRWHRRTWLELASAADSAAPEPVRIAGTDAAGATVPQTVVADTRLPAAAAAAAAFEPGPGS
jgi:hypothetical protein